MSSFRLQRRGWPPEAVHSGLGRLANEEVTRVQTSEPENQAETQEVDARKFRYSGVRLERNCQSTWWLVLRPFDLFEKRGPKDD